MASRGFAAFRQRPYALYWCSRVLASTAIAMLDTSVGWQVYRLTGDPLDLGLVGLAQFAPFAALFLVTGMVADRFSRVRILALCVALQAAGAAAFFAMSWAGVSSFGPILLVLVFFGVARAFQSSVHQAMIPNLVETQHVSNAIAWSSSGMQVSRIGGPAVAGILIAVGDVQGVHELPVYGIVAVLLAVAFVLSLFIRMKRQVRNREPVTMTSLMAGLRFIWSRQVIFAAISLDLFAVLFGGATALLPIYARDILQVGAEGLGILRSSFMVGAFAGAIVLTQFPVRRNAGQKLLVSAGMFGAAVAVFGISESFWLSLAALFVMGLSDVISVFVRHTLIQLITPDEMRGRVGAAVGVFVGASNEVGEFRAGLAAHWWGATVAVVAGGAMTVAVVALFAWMFPSLRRVDSLEFERLVREYQIPHDRRGRRAGEAGRV